MKILNCSNDANKIVELITSKKFLALEPVIAGGFAYWLFELVYSKPKKVEEALRSIKAAKKISDLEKLSSGRINIRSQRFSKLTYGFGDVDSWFLKDNDLWNENNRLHLLLNTNAYKSDVEAAGTHIGFEKMTHQSKWAHTFENRVDHNSDLKKLQIIARSHDDIEELLETFDIDGCKIAWHNKKFYLSDEFIRAIKAKEIIINDNTWNKAHHFQKTQTVIRAFKYYRRTGMALSKSSIDKVFQLYQDIIEQNNKGPVKIISNIVRSMLPNMNPKSAHTISAYGNGSQFMKRFQHDRIINDFLSFVVQDHFDDSMLPFFINTGIKEIDYIAKEAIEYASGSKPELKILPLKADDDFEF